MSISMLRFANLAKFVGIFLLAILMQHAAKGIVLSFTMEWEGECTKRELVIEGERIRLLLSCGERDAYTEQKEVIIATTKYDGTIHCAVYHYDEATCQLPEEEKEEG